MNYEIMAPQCTDRGLHMHIADSMSYVGKWICQE